MNKIGRCLLLCSFSNLLNRKTEWLFSPSPLNRFFLPLSSDQESIWWFSLIELLHIISCFKLFIKFESSKDCSVSFLFRDKASLNVKGLDLTLFWDFSKVSFSESSTNSNWVSLLSLVFFINLFKMFSVTDDRLLELGRFLFNFLIFISLGASIFKFLKKVCKGFFWVSRCVEFAIFFGSWGYSIQMKARTTFGFFFALFGKVGRG